LNTCVEGGKWCEGEYWVTKANPLSRQPFLVFWMFPSSSKPIYKMHLQTRFFPLCNNPCLTWMKKFFRFCGCIKSLGEDSKLFYSYCMMYLLRFCARKIFFWGGGVTKRKGNFELCSRFHGNVFYIRRKRETNKLKELSKWIKKRKGGWKCTRKRSGGREEINSK